MTALRELSPDFREPLLAFAAEPVEFVIVGADALALPGVARFTGALDVFARPSADNAERVWRSLVNFGAPVTAAGVHPADFAAPGIVYQIGLPPARIDILTAISGVTFDEAWASRETTDLEEAPIWFIGRAAFLRNKAAAGRPKDLADAARLIP